jgi:hypothetical protein
MGEIGRAAPASMKLVTPTKQLIALTCQRARCNLQIPFTKANWRTDAQRSDAYIKHCDKYISKLPRVSPLVNWRRRLI